MYLSIYSAEHRIILSKDTSLHRVYICELHRTLAHVLHSWVHSQDAILNRGSAGLYRSFDQGLSRRINIEYSGGRMRPPPLNTLMVTVTGTLYLQTVRRQWNLLVMQDKLILGSFIFYGICIKQYIEAENYMNTIKINI